MIQTKETNSEHMCPVCSCRNVTLFLEIVQVPVHCNLLWTSCDEALNVPRGDILLGYCRGCGFIYNLRFDPERIRYNENYENSLHFSPRFQRYAEDLSRRLINKYQLYKKDIIDIGCGRGEFLELLCQMGGNRGVGFDPACENGSPNADTGKKVTLIPDFYSERYLQSRADFICCRQVLEHINNPKHFLDGLQGAIADKKKAVFFFEVPNTEYILQRLAIWDLIYEHFSYFSSVSVERLFSSCGFRVLSVDEAFEGQFLCIEAAPSTINNPRTSLAPEKLRKLEILVISFASGYGEKLAAWRERLEHMIQEGKRAVVWGAGSKGVSFLNTLSIHDQIAYVVDLNPRKHGFYLPGTGQQIVEPSFLKGYQPEILILMNPTYEKEIQNMAKKLGLKSEIICA